MTRHLTSLLDFDPDTLLKVVELAKKIKAKPNDYAQKLAGKSIAMIFAKQSTRTRISFEVGIHELGGHSLALSQGGPAGMQMGRGETVHDTAHVLSRFVQGIVIRTFEQSDVDGLAKHGSVPVVNALTDMFHPCQALADLLTIDEHLGSTKGKKLVYIGAGNNVAHSLMLAGPRCGMDVTCCSPVSLPPNAYVTKRAMADAAEFGTKIELESDPKKAVEGAHILYTDTWVSMGEEEESKRLMRILDGYTINDELMGIADKNAIFMHCLPAHRGEEVTASVMDGPQSVVFDEAENRLHAQKALLVHLFDGS